MDDLNTFLESHDEELGELVNALDAEDEVQFVGTVTGLLTTFATGIAPLGKLAASGMNRAFGESAYARIQKEISLLADEERTAEAIRSQLPRALSELLARTIDGLDGEKRANDETDPLAGFADDVRARLSNPPDISVEEMNLLDRAIGFKIRDSRRSIFVSRMTARGDSVGFDLG